MSIPVCLHRTLCVVLVLGWCIPARAESVEFQNQIRRLLRWERHVESPFLMMGRRRLPSLREIRTDDRLSPLRTALLDRARSYTDPENAFYLGDPVWTGTAPLLLRHSNVEMIRYYCAAMLDIGFASYLEVGRDLRRAGVRLLLRTMQDLRLEQPIGSAAPPCELLLRDAELLAGITLAYDLLATGFDAKDRGPFLEDLEQERTYLGHKIQRHIGATSCTPWLRADVAACFGLVTLFSSATFAERLDRRSYQDLYRIFLTDLCWATQTLEQAWEGLAASAETASLETLAYPSFYTLVFAQALRRVGGPDLLAVLPTDPIVTAIASRKIPDEPLVVARAEAEPDPSRPDQWPPEVRQLFWIEGEGPDTDVPTPLPRATPTPTPLPRQIVRFAQHLRAIRSGPSPRAPTPTPIVPGWSPPRRAGMPSVWGPVILLLSQRGNNLAHEIWRDGGVDVSSHPATLAWAERLRRPKAPSSRPTVSSAWFNTEGDLMVVRASEPGHRFLARQVSQDGRAAGIYLIDDPVRKRILERVEELPAQDEVHLSTQAMLIAPGHVLSTYKRGGLEWTTIYRSHVTLGLPYVLSAVRACSDTIGRHLIDMPLASDEEIDAGTTTPRYVTITLPGETRRAGPGRPIPLVREFNYHLRLILSSRGQAEARVVTEEETRFLRAAQSLEEGAAFVILTMDTWKPDRSVVKGIELEEGTGVILPWRDKGYDLVAVNTGRGIRGPTIETDGRLVVLSWDRLHDAVAYLLADGTYLRASPSLRKSPLRDLVYGTRRPVTVSWSGRCLVLAEGCSLHGRYYAPGIRLARRGEDRLVAYRRAGRVSLSRRPVHTLRFRTIQTEGSLR